MCDSTNDYIELMQRFINPVEGWLQVFTWNFDEIKLDRSIWVVRFI